MPCLDDHLVLRFVSGALDPSQCAVVEAEVGRCNRCAALVAAVAREADADCDTGEGTRYEVGEVLARGGMGTIVRAFDRRLGREVALKRLDQSSDAARARFAREIQITATLQHPNIVPIYDAGTLPQGRPFYAMRHVAGRSLDEAIADARTPEARLALLGPILRAAEALAYAHDRGVVHRDVKPLNVLVGPFGETLVIDWGLAKATQGLDALDLSPGEGPLGLATTSDGAILGTPRYMAPEQARGEPATAASDVYALGAILRHALVGRAATDELHFGRPDAAAAVAALGTVPRRPLADVSPELPRDLIAIIDRAMAYAPCDRYRDAGALADDLRRFQTGQLVLAYRYSRSERVRRFARQHRLALAVTAAAAALLVFSYVRVVAERDDAAAATIKAREQRRAAQRQRAGAELLMQFMVSDLRATLDTMGRLDVLTGISDRVDRYLAATADGRDPGTRRALARSLELRSAALRATSDRKQAGELTARALALLDQADTEEHSVSTTEVRASLLTAQALDAAAGGDFELARLKHRAAASAWSSLIGKPGQPLAAANAARALASVGETADRLGDRLEAELAWRQASATLDTARTAATPSEANEVASAEALVRFSMGKALRRSGELAASERELTAALDVLAPALAQPHAAYEPRRVAIMTLQLLADTKIARGIDDVHPLHVRAHALATASVAAEPSNRQMRKQLAQAWRELARDADLQGDPLRAIANLELALAEYERLIALGDDDVLLRRNTAIVSSELGDTLAPRDVKKARAAVAKAVELFLGLARAGDARTQLDVVFALRQASALERRAGQPAAAWAHAEKALAVLEQTPPLADEPPVATFYRAAGLAEAAAVERQLGRTAGAKAHRAAALGLVAALERSGKLQAGWLEEIEGARKR